MYALAVTSPRPDQRLRLVTDGQALPAAAEASPVRDTADSSREDAFAAGRGDRAAFERLYRSQLPKIYSLVARMLGSHGDVAEEVVQDVFVRAWRKLPTFRGDAAVSTWLHRLAVNVVLSRRKSEGIQRERMTDDEYAVDVAPARHTSVGERLDLDGAIARLPKGARQVFVLHDVEGYTHEEIGREMGITPGGSKAQLHRARMLLREALNR